MEGQSVEGQNTSENGEEVTARSRIGSVLSLAPPALVGAAVWAGCLVVLGTFVYFAIMVLGKLFVIVVAFFAAMLFSALLHRPVAFLQRHRWPRSISAAGVMIAALALFVVVWYFVVSRISAQAPELMAQVEDVIDNLKSFLQRIPGDSSIGFSDVAGRVEDWISAHRSAVLGEAFAAGRTVAEVVTWLFLTAFLTLFFLAHGDQIWSWLVRLTPTEARASINGAGYRAWCVLSGWIVGTAIIASIHAVVIGTAMWLLGTPLVLPLAVLVFIGSFIPLIGAMIAGGIAVLVTLLSVGFIPALVLLVVLVFENYAEGFILQPLIVGRAVQLHAVPVVVVVTAATLVGGLVGAIIAIPIVASVYAAVKYLTHIEDIDGKPLRDEDRREPMTPPRVAPRKGPSPARRWWR